MKRLISAALCLSLVFPASGCSGGSIYSNYRDIAELTVVRTLGFDLTPEGAARISAAAEDSSGEGGREPVRVSADALSVTAAQDSLQYSGLGRRLFFGHCAYFVLGQSVLDGGIGRFFDCVERSPELRLSVPVFAVSGGSAEALVMGAGDGGHDASALLRALCRQLSLRGEEHVFTAAEIVSELDRNGAALVCALRCEASEDGKTRIVPDGYTIIYNKRAIGRIPAELSRGVSVIRSEAGPMTVTLDGAALRLYSCSCRLSPDINADGALRGVSLDIELGASLAESGGESDPGALCRMLEDEVRSWVEGVLAIQSQTGCDFLQLGSSLELRHPLRLHGAGESLAPGLSYTVNVSASLVFLEAH